MTPDTTTAPNSTAALWTGRIMSFLPALFMLLDAAMKFTKPEMVVKTTVDLKAILRASSPAWG